jgi:hypothetical protein
MDQPVKMWSKPDTFIKSSFLIVEYLPNIRTIVRIVQHLRNHESYKPQTQDRGVQLLRGVANMEEDILMSVKNQAGTSSRRLARQHNHVTMCKNFSVCSLGIYHVDRNFANRF